MIHTLCLQAKKQEDSERLAAEKAEREALKKQRKMEKQQQRKLRQQQKHPQKYNHNKGRHVIEFPSGRKEVWLFPNSLDKSVVSVDVEGSKVGSSEDQAHNIEIVDKQDGEFSGLTLSEVLKMSALMFCKHNHYAQV